MNFSCHDSIASVPTEEAPANDVRAAFDRDRGGHPGRGAGNWLQSDVYLSASNDGTLTLFGDRRAAEDGTDRPTVLVVGHDADAAELLTAFLKEAGYSVALARSAAQAVYLAHVCNPAAIAADILLPGKGGATVLDELKRHPAIVGIPVLAVSVAPDGEVAFRQGGLHGFVKPVDRSRLLAAVESVGGDDAFPTRILVVNDDPAMLDPLTDTPDQTCFEVVREATDALPDVIVLDLMMRDVSGFEAVRRLQEHPEAREIPVLVYTANAITDADRAALGRRVLAILPGRGKYALLNELDRLIRGQPDIRTARSTDHHSGRNRPGLRLAA